ncbi:MAG TPA: class I SAM-dependent methyltransferase [Anaerolineae bacterium]|nr:class I SAM-dependent methyltransferase [Anaerolineae bacterium]
MKKEIYDQIQNIEQTHWWYVARRKIIFDWVLRILGDYPIPRVLDIGCGTGFNIQYLHTYGYEQVTGLDFSAEAMGFCRSRHLAGLVCSDGARPSFCTESFDVVMALDLIEHLEDDVQGLYELIRLLRPNGSLIIFTPAFNFLWGLQDEVGHHYRRYTAAELQQKLKAVGLSICKLTYANTFLFPFIWAGRTALRLSGNKIQATSENDLHPGWSNALLQTIFAAERPLLRYVNFPFGVSLLCIAKKSSPGRLSKTGNGLSL